jgi:membrane-bound lytic murein transglycosylase A
VRRAAGWASAAALLLLAACAVHAPAPAPPPPGPSSLTLARADFAALPGWKNDDQAAALAALLQSCPILIQHDPTDWQGPCADGATVPAGDGAAARVVLERDFVPFQAGDNGNPQGLFTGYYEAELHGALQPGGRFTVPLYRRPADLVSVDLGQFRPEWRGRRIAGKLVGSKLEPYAARPAIEAGALAGQGLELLWVDDPVDAFFLAVQGSGRVILPDGRVVRVGYDGDNGQPYVSIGKLLIETGVPKDEITMPFLRQWIAQHPAEGRQLMDGNPSYVFFKDLAGPGPLGAQGVVLTPGRSLAVDPAFVAYGLPVWIDATDPTESSGRLQRLLIAQDTGGAIRGPVRGDVFFGYGAEAAAHAGVLKGQGTWWLLLPRALADRQEAGTRQGISGGAMEKRRRVSEAERALWLHTMRDATPLPGRTLLVPVVPAPSEPDPSPIAKVVASPTPPTEILRSPTPPVPLALRTGLPAPGLDRATAERLTRGRVAIEARLDLHGMTQDQARGALDGFIGRAWDSGLRGVLVITGKGGSGDEWGGTGILRRNVPRWLAEAPNRARVLAFTEAQPRHGGGGALYVLIRRRRA